MERLVGETTARHSVEPLSPSRFYCHLDDQPDHLVPRQSLGSQDWEDPADRFFVHPEAFITQDETLSPQLANTSGLDKFAFEHAIAWVCDPGTGALQPFWISPTTASALEEIGPGNSIGRGMPDGMTRALAIAGILVPHDYAATRKREWMKTVSACARQFRDKGYVPMADLIHPFHIAALRRYYRMLMRTGQLALGDDQCSRRYVAHNESVARFFHRQLTSTMAAVAGEPVKPSYVYIGSYQEGATLEKHTDREQCEFSLTLCLDYSPEPRRETNWPILLHTRDARVTVYQALGNALFYRGCEIPHSRKALPSGHTSTSIFFHYVRESFEGPLD